MQNTNSDAPWWDHCACEVSPRREPTFAACLPCALCSWILRKDCLIWGDFALFFCRKEQKGREDVWHAQDPPYVERKDSDSKPHLLHSQSPSPQGIRDYQLVQSRAVHSLPVSLKRAGAVYWLKGKGKWVGVNLRMNLRTATQPQRAICPYLYDKAR